MVHRYHPDPATEDPGNAVLWDDCSRCAQHATDLVSLDDDNLMELWDRVQTGAPARTRAERLAMDNLERAEAVLNRIVARTPRG